jgi:DNA repair photolyase
MDNQAGWNYSTFMRRTITGRQKLSGRGALSNPPGRFDLTKIEAVDDGWYLEESPESIATTLEPERARSVITHNDSPDIPFEQSVNPYRGCENACSYCAFGETPILMADGRTRPIAKLRTGDLIYGTVRRGWYRRYVLTRVRAHWSTIKPAYRTTLEDGTTLVTSGDHRFLTERGWKFVTNTPRVDRAHLTTCNRLMGTGAFTEAVAQDDDYRRGYLCGMIRGDGPLRSYTYSGANGRLCNAHQFRLALCDNEALYRTRDFLRHVELETREYVFSVATHTRRALKAISANGGRSVGRVREVIAWPNSPPRAWLAGFLAGIFDAEGSFSHTVLRIANTDAEIIGWICTALRTFGFTFVVEHTHHEGRKPIDAVRLTGGLKEHLRFFHTVGPAITRKLNIEGQALKSEARLGVVRIEPLGTMRLYDITTESGDFIGNGVVNHNCYARPSHAYLGLSPGIDFETRLFYKADAAKLLEGELARPDYVCKPIMLGANTDPYQPVERRMKVTRSVLEVLARTRHPVTVVTKSALVLRDLDLLTDLAKDGLTSVAVSVTSLDAELKRRLEPRAASPQARLRTLAALSAAGVPTGVLVAPVIPALTDHEMEAILEAAAGAGVRWAGYVLLRLPYEIKDLFTEWLAEHYPGRAQHVMSLIRSMRGGRDNDPNFGTRMRGTGPYALLLRNRFRVACRRLNLNPSARDTLNTALFAPRVPAGAQLRLGL